MLRRRQFKKRKEGSVIDKQIRDDDNAEIEEGELPQRVVIYPQLANILNPMFEDVRSMLIRERVQNDQIRGLEEKLRAHEKRSREEYNQMVEELARALKRVEKDVEYYKGKVAALSAENERLRGSHAKMLMRPGTSSDHPAERPQPEIVLVPMDQVDREMSKIHRAAMSANQNLASVLATFNDMQDIAAHVGRNRPRK